MKLVGNPLEPRIRFCSSTNVPLTAPGAWRQDPARIPTLFEAGGAQEGGAPTRPVLPAVLTEEAPDGSGRGPVRSGQGLEVENDKAPAHWGVSGREADEAELGLTKASRLSLVFLMILFSVSRRFWVADKKCGDLCSD